MENYKELYFTLWNTLTDAIASIDAQNYGLAKALLIKAQQEAEDKFIASEEN